MRRILQIVCFLIVLAGNAQNRLIPTQHAFNRLNYNPGYTGVKDGFNASSLTRTQRLSGVSTSYYALSMDMPVRFYSMGVGLSLEQQQVAGHTTQQANFSYSYKIQVNEGVLSFGTGLGLALNRLSRRGLNIESESDPTIGFGHQLNLNISLGSFYQKENYYIGISLNRPLNRPAIAEKYLAKPEAYYAALAGYDMSVSDRYTLRFASFVSIERVVLPYFSAVIDYNQQFWVGSGYRLESEFGINAGVNLATLVHGVSLPIKLGMAYVIPLDHGVGVSNGVELFLSYNFVPRPTPERIKRQKRIVSPVIFY